MYVAVEELATALDTLSRSAHTAAVWARCGDVIDDVDFRKRVIQILDQALEVSRALTPAADSTKGNSGVSDLVLNL